MKEKRLIWILLAAALVLLLGIFAIWRWSGTPAVQNLPTTEAPEQLVNTTPGDPEPPQTQETDVTEPKPTETDTESTETDTEPTGEAEPTEATEPVNVPETTTTSPLPEPEPTEPDDPQQRIDELIALAYELRDEYKTRLAQIESNALAQYDALAPDKRTWENKETIIRAAVNEAYALEAECDGRISDICNELSYLLLDTHGDMYLISEVRYAYAAEKNAVRNDFLERYSEYLG